MRKLFKILLRLAVFIGMSVLVFMLYNALTVDSRQIVTDPVEKVEIADTAITRLSAGIRLPTVSAGAIDSTAFRNLDTLLQVSFPLVDSLLEREQVNDFGYIYKWPGTNPRLEPILLLGHTDVVAADANDKDWAVPPFSGAIRDGCIWGRGALDDKLSVFGILEATEMLLAEGYDPERTVYFAFGQDEEVGGKKGAIPMSRFFAERGITFEYILDEGSVILKNALDGLDKPLAMIGISEKGYTTLTLTAVLENGGHSSMPPPETAVGVLAAAVTALQDNPFPSKIDGATRLFFEYIAPECAFPQKILFSNLTLTEGLITRQLSKDNTSAAILRTTTAPTMLRGGIQENVLPRRASAKVNFRILPGETVESVREYVRQIIDDKRILVEVSDPEFSNDPPPLSPTESFGFQVIQKTIGQTFPQAVTTPSLVIATTDARHYSAVSPNIYRFMPLQISRTDLKTIHGINEKIAAEGYKDMIRFYRQLIVNSCK